jgi:RNA polymerase sigma-70 factor (ECF subfamily)
MTTNAAGDATVQAQIYRWAYRFLRNHHDALDATQDVLLKWLKAGSERVESRNAWLRRMTTNHCIDLIRRRRTSARRETEMLQQGTGGTVLEERELRDAVASGLETLSDRQRAVIIAKVYDRETFAAIAEAMGLSISSVKTHYMRGLRALRDTLRPQHGE